MAHESNEIVDFGQHSEHLAVIGAFSIIAANIEYAIELTLLGLLQTDRRYGGATIRWVSTPQQIDLIKKIIADKHGEDSEINKAMRLAIDKVKIAIDTRNQYAHATYLHLEGPDKTFKQRHKRGAFDSHLEHVDLAAMSSDLEKASNAYYGYLQIVAKHALSFPRT